MTILIWVLCIMFFVSLAYCLSIYDDEELLGKFALATLAISSLLLGVTIALDSSDQTPTAKDVYRGRTTLSVSYKVVEGDTIAKDTVVVFKKNLD